MREQAECPKCDFAARVAKRVAELSDRTSPDYWPEAMLVTTEELIFIINNEVDRLVKQMEANPPGWQPIETAPKHKDLLLGYQAEGKAHLISKLGVGSFSAFGLVDWPWTMMPTHWQEIPELKPKTDSQ